jgi:hypothetical protein
MIHLSTIFGYSAHMPVVRSAHYSRKCCSCDDSIWLPELGSIKAN